MKKFALAFILLLVLCSLLVSIPEIRIAKAEGTIYIRADGSVEGTDEIQRNGNVYSFTGDISDSIVIEKDDIVLDGKEYALRGEGGDKGISLDGRNNVTIKNLQVRDFDTCIFLDNSSNNEISGNTLVSTLGGGITSIIRLESFSNNNLISGNTIGLESGGEDHAINIRKSLYNVIAGNNITSNMRCIGLDNYTNHTTITGNTLTSTNNWGGVTVWGKYNITFTNNILIGCSLHLYRSSHNTIENNLVNNKPLVYLEDVSDQTVDYGGQVILVNCNNMRVKNLDLSDITKGGVQLLYTNNTEISNYIGSLFFETSCHNRIIGSNCVELSFYRSSYNIITGNTITNAEGVDYSSGFMLESSNNNNIYANNITANRYSGIRLYSCFNNSIHGNNISENQEGIILKYCFKTTNIIYENNITNNHNAGVFVDGSSGNILYNNNFVDNNRHVMGWDSTNVWDNGSKGNYWDDYNGTDTNHDGIGDSPYSIHINSHFSPNDIVDYDNYPLMNHTHATKKGTFLSITPSNYTAGGDSMHPLTATLTDADGNPLAGKAIIWFVTLGILSPPTENLTNSVGQATTFYRPGGVDGETPARIIAEFAGDELYEGSRGISEVTIVPGSPPPPAGTTPPFLTTFIVATMVITAIGGAALLIYFKKIKRTTEVKEVPEGVK